MNRQFLLSLLLFTARLGEFHSISNEQGLRVFSYSPLENLRVYWLLHSDQTPVMLYAFIHISMKISNENAVNFSF